MKNSILKFAFALAIFSASGTFAQQDSTRNWKLGVNISPEIGYRYLTQDNGSSPIMSYIIDQRNEMEKSVLVFSAGLSAERKLGKRFSLRSGLQYSVRGEEMKVTYIFPNGTQQPGTLRSYYHFVGVPINVSYVFLQREKFNLFANLGADMNFMYLTSLYKNIPDPNGQSSIEHESQAVNDDNPTDYNIFNPAARISVGIDLSVGNRSTIRIEPNFKYSMRQLVDAPINGYYYNYGVNVGYLFSI